MAHRQTGDGTTISVVMTKNVSQSPTSRSTRAPEAANRVLPAVLVEAGSAYRVVVQVRSTSIEMKATKMMSWVAEAMTMTRPTATTPARFVVGSIMRHSTRHARITPCKVTIRARRCPNRSVSQGTRSRSISGARSWAGRKCGRYMQASELVEDMTA